MDMIALSETARQDGHAIPRGPRSSQAAAGRCAPKIALIVAAAYVALGIGTPWLLQDAPPLVYEVVAARAAPPASAPVRASFSPAPVVEVNR
jgi:hypothetical protein